MRYLDTGSRNPENTLGHWLKTNVLDDESITAVRLQTGFFGADILGYFIPAFQRLSEVDGHISILIGSNEGTTGRADMEVVLALAGQPRDSLNIGVVRFSSGYFHPKTVHITRADGSEAGYVGSANLTGSGAAGHVEAGIALDWRDGDNPVAALLDMSLAIDAWFEEQRDGLHVVTTAEDLDALVAAGVLGVPRPPRRRRTGAGAGAGQGPVGPVLGRLVDLPGLPANLAATLRTGAIIAEAEAIEEVGTGGAQPALLPPTVAAGDPRAAVEDVWSKKLPASDAQRKAQGNQRGGITLVKGHRRDINHQTYFREDLFAEATWVPETTHTNKPFEVALIDFRTEVLGDDLGTLGLRVSYESSRDQGVRSNYTSILHLDGLSQRFHDEDMTGRVLTIRRLGDGSFSLAITEE